ncbi:MAG: hypothetical protein HDS68_05630 [Bacteroidales bacterium]|nr:hypothetical protein [Bacteroidales bacterium]
MPRNISKPSLNSTRKLTPLEMTKIHFGRPALQSPTSSGSGPADRDSVAAEN